MRLVKVTLLALLSSVYACASESTPAELAQFGKDMPALVSAAKLKAKVAVTMISPRVMGCALETADVRVVIIDHGYAENVKTLKHELNHLKRYEAGDKDWREDGPATKAETE